MLISVSGGWTKDEARNELDLKVKVVGDDAQEVAHLESIVADDWTVENISFAGGELVMDVKAARKVSLADQAAAKAAADKKAADKAAAEAKMAAAEAAKKSAEDVRVQGIASAAAKAAVEALTK